MPVAAQAPPAPLPAGPVGPRDLPPLPPEPPPPPAAPAAPELPPRTIDVNADYLEQWPEGPFTVSLLTGNVRVQDGPNAIEADTLLGWSSKLAAPDAPARAGRALMQEFDQAYAEGNVRLRRPGRGDVFAERVFVDFRSGQGIFLDFRLRATEPKTRQTLVLRAEVAREVARDFFVAQPATVTTCTYHKPHYDIHIRRIEFARSPDAAGGVLHLDDLVLRIGGAPAGYWPLLSYEIGRPLPLRQLSAANTSRFGPTVLSEWGFSIDTVETGPDGLPVLDRHGRPKAKRWGDVTLEADFRDRRGWGTGLDLEYDSGDAYEGFLDTYYLEDRGRHLGNDFDRTLEAASPLRHEDRGRAHAFHRHRLSDAWRADVELDYISDRDLLLEFFPREQRETKEHESYLYLRGLYDNWAFTYLQRDRLNDWQSQTEYMPQLGAVGVAEPVPPDLFPGLYFFTATEAANLRRNFDDRADHLENSTRIWRFDSANEIWRPFSLGPLRLAPYAGARWGAFEESLADSNTRRRFIGSVGSRAEVQAHRVYGTEWEAVGLHGLRHVVSAEARYTNAYEDTAPSRDLIAFDAVDAADEFQEAAWRLTQRFQTKTGPPDQRRIVDFLWLRAALETYPDPGRDTGRRRDQNHLAPFHWIALAPDPAGTTAFGERRYSDLFWGADFAPETPWSVRLDGEYDPKARHPEAFEATVLTRVAPWARLGVGYYAADQITQSFSVSAFVQPTPRLNLFTQTSHDFENDRDTGRRIGAQWDVHDAYFEVLLHIDPIRDDKQFLVGLTPKFTGQKGSLLHGGFEGRGEWTPDGNPGGP